MCKVQPIGEEALLKQVAGCYLDIIHAFSEAVECALEMAKVFMAAVKQEFR